MRFNILLAGFFGCYTISFAVKADWFLMRTTQDDETAFLWLVASLNARRHPQVDEVQQHPFQRQTGFSDTHNNLTNTESREWDKSTNRRRVEGNRGKAQEWRIYRTIQKISMLELLTNKFIKWATKEVKNQRRNVWSISLKNFAFDLNSCPTP